MSKPIVAIVGRPNVGKSTLFNVLAGERISIVKDFPGVTRDRIYAEVSWLNYQFTMIDTGGIEPESKDMMLTYMRQQAQTAIDTADIIKKSEKNDEVTVRFTTEQINLLKDEKGEVIEGDKMSISVMTDTWVFKKVGKDAWIITATESRTAPCLK